MDFLLLAAGVGKRLAPHTEVRPKCLLEVDNRSLLAYHLENAERAGADRFNIVVGHLGHMIRDEVSKLSPSVPVRFIENANYQKGSILSLAVGLAELRGKDIIFMDADVFYHRDVLLRLVQSASENCVLVDESSEESGEEMMIGIAAGRAKAIARRVKHLEKFDCIGESVGFFRVGGRSREQFDAVLAETQQATQNEAEYEEALHNAFGELPFGYETVSGLPWTEIDFEEDLLRARRDVAPRILALG